MLGTFRLCRGAMISTRKGHATGKRKQGPSQGSGSGSGSESGSKSGSKSGPEPGLVRVGDGDGDGWSRSE